MKDALFAFLASHAIRENRMVNGVGYQFIVFDTCPLCVAGLAALSIKDPEYEIVRDSDPPERVVEQPAE